jgi:hypothetical protein
MVAAERRLSSGIHCLSLERLPHAVRGFAGGPASYDMWEIFEAIFKVSGNRLRRLGAIWPFTERPRTSYPE